MNSVRNTSPLTPVIITAFTSILNLFSSIIFSLTDSTALELCYQQAELFTKIICDVNFLPTLSDNPSASIQISSMTLIGHLANMGSRVRYSLQKEDIEEIMEDCKDNNNFDVQKMYFYADQSLSKLFKY